VVVVPDGGGEGEDALQDADQHTGGGLAAVAFEVELAFVGIEDRFDGLAQGFEEAAAGSLGFAFAGWPEQGQACFGQGGLEFGAEVVLVPDEGLGASVGVEAGVGVQDVEQDGAFVGFGSGEREADGQPVQGGEQVQAESPEVAGVAGAVAVLAPIRPARCGVRPRGSGRIPPGWSRLPTRRRSTGWCRGRASRSAS
jgi:hypothetical protein